MKTLTMAVFLVSGLGLAGCSDTYRELDQMTGRLSLPTEYPLLKGDSQLWATMTRSQQERAMLFLAGGSTISSSLQPD